MFHAQMAALRCWFYGDWVPSKANPADVPTRADGGAGTRDAALGHVGTDGEMVLPALEAVERNVGACIQEVRAHVRQSRAAPQRD
jgi:hypothetical protein